MEEKECCGLAAAAAYEKACRAVCIYCAGEVVEFSQEPVEVAEYLRPGTWWHEIKEDLSPRGHNLCLASEIRSIISPDAKGVLEEVKREARLEEAKWWLKRVPMHYHVNPSFVPGGHPLKWKCEVCERIAELSAPTISVDSCDDTKRGGTR